jgi:hypothetical protein
MKRSNLCSSLCISRVTEPNRIRWAGNVAHIVALKNFHKILYPKMFEVRNLSENLDIDGK